MRRNTTNKFQGAPLPPFPLRKTWPPSSFKKYTPPHAQRGVGQKGGPSLFPHPSAPGGPRSSRGGRRGISFLPMCCYTFYPHKPCDTNRKKKMYYILIPTIER
eukprot:FR743280.1.p4 GENE.FR743280.1~~FR743280.1.p4  ORF type:complete len:103 (+),score=10.38 FR743280.1:931-1239(+)